MPELSGEYIRDRIAEFEWFVHVDFGDGIVARSTAWPDAPADSRHMGVAKFEFIVRPNLPDLHGARVLDLGCNCGLVAIHMARLGAAEVVGVDLDEQWPKWQEQAEFVKSALEWRSKTTYNIRYVEMNMRDLPTAGLGRFEIVTALNCLYYLEEPDIERVTAHVARTSNLFAVQCNTRDHDGLGRRSKPAYMRSVLERNGFPRTHVAAPWDPPKRRFWPQRYHRPLVVGTKK